MKSRRGSDESCFCSSCLYKHNNAYRGITRTGSKIDKLYRDKYLPLRESKLINKLERTRAAYDDIRAPYLSDSESKRTSIKKRRDSTELNKWDVDKTIGDTDVSRDYGYVRESTKRRVRFKPEFIKSEPCVCLAKFSSLIKRHSEILQSKLKREFSAPLLRNKIKKATSKQRSRVGKAFKFTEKIVSYSNPKLHLEEMLNLSVKKMPQPRDNLEYMKQNSNYKGSKYRKELDPRRCPCPQEKLVLKIRKDSIRKFYEDLEKKRTLKHLECKSECIQDICIPKECLDRIKLSKEKKNTKKKKKSQKQRKSLKRIVSKASRRKRKKSVMCQCDDISIPTKEGDKHETYVRQNKVKFVPSKKSIQAKSFLRSNPATLHRKQSKTDGNTLKRCFCTLKFKPTGSQNKSHFYSPTSEFDYYAYSGQSGDMKMNSTQMHKTIKRAVKSKSNCTVNDCNPDECLRDYNKRKRQMTYSIEKKYKRQPAAKNQPNTSLPEPDRDNRRALRIGSSISFNIEFFKENVPQDTHKSVKTNTIPHYISNNSLKSIRPQESNKNFTRHKRKRKVIIMDNLKKNNDINLNKNISSKLLTKIKKYAHTNNNVELKDTNHDIDLKTEMINQSTKITNKDKRLLKPFECEPEVCVPDNNNCDPHLCLKRGNRHKNVITTTDFPKMISVASGVHKRKFKHVQAQSKQYFQRKNSFADLNTFVDHEQTESNVQPKISNKNTLRFSSNFSFAIEIGKGVVPHMNPVDTFKRYSSIYKGKNRKSRINSDNYTERKNKSKNSLFNTMVKRCMCTLNLSKQRNRNQSPNKANGMFAPNAYTVNTVLTSSIKLLSAKHRSEKITSCLNEYKFDINHFYPACHSHITLTKNNRRGQLKKKLCIAFKSLSFLSDTNLKKNADWTRHNKSITLYELNDYTSRFCRVEKHQTFTKSSKYWEKSYCTMNFKTIYSRNGKTKKGIENDSQKNCVRVGSNINFNIEFYKNNVCLDPKNSTLATKTRKGERFRSQITQNAISRSNKEAFTAVSPKERCFCTLKLQKKSDTNHLSKQKLPTKFNLKPTASYVSKSQNTPKNTGLENIQNEMSTTENINTVPKEQSFPRECIPGMCIPGECNPAFCYDILYKRKLKTRSTSAATKVTKKIPAGVFTQQSSVKNAKTQSQNIESHKKTNARTHNRTSIPYSNIDSGKQCAKFGSNISFNIEFFKENSPTSKPTHYEPEAYDKKYRKSSKYADASVSSKTQDFNLSKLRARPHDSFIKRCFCTLKLQKKQKKPLLTEVHSVGVMAGVKNKWYSDKTLSNHVNMNKGDATSIYSTKSNLRKHKENLTGEKEIKSKHRDKLHMAVNALLPHECEPGTCVPGTCNPYECIQRINARKLIKRDIGSVTTRLNKKSLGIMSMYRTPPKHRRIQTVPFQKNDLGVSRVIPKQLKQKNNLSSNDQCLRIGSNINFSIEFFKNKNCDQALQQKSIYRHNKVIKTSSPTYKHAMNTKAVMPHVTKKHKETKHALNQSQEPIVNFQVRSKKQTLSQLSQTRQKYFSKHKGLLRYECEPNVCIPGHCDPYKCYDLIQRRNYKDCSAITVANVRDFATNATPCYTCKSKRIQTGRHRREGSDAKLMKSALGQRTRNSIRISSNFGFHIEICKKGDNGPAREVQVHDDKYKKVNSRLRDQASQSQYRRRAKSTNATSKLQRCFCTKKFFNSFAKTTSRNFEYTTNYCALVPKYIVPIPNDVYCISSSHDQHFIYSPVHLDNQKKGHEPTNVLKHNTKPKRLLKIRRNKSKVFDEDKTKSYLSFDLELYKRNKCRKGVHKTVNKICSHQHIFIPKQKSNKLKGLKLIDCKSIQGQGDSQKPVGLKRCYSTFNFARKKYEGNCKTEQGSVDLRYETIQQALKEEGYCIKYILTDSTEADTFHLPQAKIMRWDEIHGSLLRSNNTLFNTYAAYRVLATENKLIEIKKHQNLNYNVGDKEKHGYFRNVYNKLHPFVDKLGLKQLLKNVKSLCRSVSIAESTR